MSKCLKGEFSIEQLNKNATLLKDTLDYLNNINTLCHSKEGISNNADLLSSANFQLLQVSRNLKRTSNEVLELMPSIDIITLHSLSKNLIHNYYLVNHAVLISFLKSISKNAIKNEITYALKVIHHTKMKMIYPMKKRRKRNGGTS